MDVKFELELNNCQSLCALPTTTTWQIRTNSRVVVVAIAMELNGNHIKLLHHKK